MRFPIVYRIQTCQGSSSVHLSRFLLSHLSKLIGLALLALVLFGVTPTANLAIIVILFVTTRIFSLVLEGRQKLVLPLTLF